MLSMLDIHLHNSNDTRLNYIMAFYSCKGTTIRTSGGGRNLKKITITGARYQENNILQVSGLEKNNVTTPLVKNKIDKK